MLLVALTGLQYMSGWHISVMAMSASLDLRLFVGLRGCQLLLLETGSEDLPKGR